VAATATASIRRRILLLGAQSFALGLVVAWTNISASAIFLNRYGSGGLPWTYVAAALAGALATLALGAAFRRRTLVSVTMRVLLTVTVALAASYVLLVASGPLVSLPLLVTVPILIPVGFIFVIGQAGALLDVRALKSSYARVVAGFALGFLVAGAVAPVVLALTDRTEDLLVLAAAASACFALVVEATRRSFPELADARG
jgi:hypothetical protein